MKIFAALALLMGLFALPSCRTTETIEAPPEGLLVHRPYYDVEGETWVLFELEGKPVELTSDPRRPAIRLSAKDGTQRVTGSGGINRLAGQYDIDAQTVKFGPLITTKMAGDPAKMELEQHFLSALSRVTGWKRQDRALLLFENTTIIARFVQQTEPVAEPWAQPAAR